MAALGEALGCDNSDLVEDILEGIGGAAVPRAGGKSGSERNTPRRTTQYQYFLGNFSKKNSKDLTADGAGLGDFYVDGGGGGGAGEEAGQGGMPDEAISLEEE